MKTLEQLKGEFIRDLTTVKAHCGGYFKSEVKLRLDEILKEQREEIINMIEGNKQNTRIETGAFKYDFAYDEIIKNI